MLLCETKNDSFMASLEESFNHLYFYRVNVEQLAVYNSVEVSEMSPFW